VALVGEPVRGREVPAPARGVLVPLRDAPVGVGQADLEVEDQEEPRMFLEVMRRTGHLLSAVVAGVWVQEHYSWPRQVHCI
jgi:hypothetical protein